MQYLTSDAGVISQNSHRLSHGSRLIGMQTGKMGASFAVQQQRFSFVNSPESKSKLWCARRCSNAVDFVGEFHIFKRAILWVSIVFWKPGMLWTPVVLQNKNLSVQDANLYKQSILLHEALLSCEICFKELWSKLYNNSLCSVKIGCQCECLEQYNAKAISNLLITLADVSLCSIILEIMPLYREREIRVLSCWSLYLGFKFLASICNATKYGRFVIYACAGGVGLITNSIKGFLQCVWACLRECLNVAVCNFI